VTLIVGVLCADGLVIASDREEAGGDKKPSPASIDVYQDSHCSLAIAGTGHGPLCDVAIERIAIAAHDEGEAFYEQHERIISDVLTALYQEFIWRTSSTDDRRIQLIIGIQERATNQRRLYLTVEEILQPKRLYACSGSGDFIANYFLERLLVPALTGVETRKLLAFIAREAKDSISGVGRETEMITFDQMGTINTSWQSRTTDREVPHLYDAMNHFWRT
jgi:20S proteasome alpha/beta subunit